MTKTSRKAVKIADKILGEKEQASYTKTVQPDAALGAVIGSRAVPRTEVSKKLWAYIKKNGLQDRKKKTNINADDKLKSVFGGRKQVSFLEMSKLVSEHLKG